MSVIWCLYHGKDVILQKIDSLYTQFENLVVCKKKTAFAQNNSVDFEIFGANQEFPPNFNTFSIF